MAAVANTSHSPTPQQTAPTHMLPALIHLMPGNHTVTTSLHGRVTWVQKGPNGKEVHTTFHPNGSSSVGEIR